MPGVKETVKRSLSRRAAGRGQALVLSGVTERCYHSSDPAGLDHLSCLRLGGSQLCRLT